MSQLYRDIERVVNSFQHGWCTVEKAWTLASSILTIGATNVLEIGVYSGRSLIPMAMALQYRHEHQDMPKGRIIGIDAWENSAASEEMTGEHKEWWSTVNINQMYDICNHHINNLQLQDYVTLVKGRSDSQQAMESIGTLVFDLIHIDGSHGEQASMFDVTYYGYKVREGGLLFMDDIEWASKAYQALPTFGYRELYKLDTGCMFQRLKSDFT